MTRLGALPAGILAGAVSGAVFGGVFGRIFMRVIFLTDQSKRGALTDFGIAGEITAGGSFALLVLCTITGVMGGAIYVGIRRWLPWASAVARGAFFGLLMIFGPGFIFLGGVDLQIFEPALPIFAGFVGLIVLYGVAVALITDRLSPPRAVTPAARPRGLAHWPMRVFLVLLLMWAGVVTKDVQDHAGTCLAAADGGGCGARVGPR
jgi:hypothetical protein